MEHIILLTFELCGVLSAFIGMAAAINWYHKGGETHVKSPNKMSGKHL